MRKVRRLVINRETLRALTGAELQRVAGGGPPYCKDCGGGDTDGCTVVTTGGGTSTCQTGCGGNGCVSMNYTACGTCHETDCWTDNC